MLKKNSDKPRLTNPLLWILLFGFFLRVLFILKGGAIFYGKKDFWLMGGDTFAWFDSFLNLLHHGTYTVNPAIENGMFFRPPGYAFIMGIVYLLCGQQTELMYMVLLWIQTLLDVVSIYLVFQIAFQSSGNRAFGYLSSLLYACYPFIIVWTPVLYAESMSIFFLLMSIFFYTKQESFKNYFFSAFFLGLASLTRLQCIPLFGILAMLILFYHKTSFSLRLKYLISFTLAFTLSYGLWPLRNYFLHNKLIFTQDLRIGGHWSPDYFSMVNYIYTIQVDAQPQRNQVLKKEKVTWPAISFIDEGDSKLLDSLSELCIKCGTGFSYFRYYEGYGGQLLTPSNNCDSIIESGFNQLAVKQKDKHPWHYYIMVPLGNLKKALFKTALYGQKSAAAMIVSTVLFGYRTLLIFLGIAGIILAWRRNSINKKLLSSIILYAAGWYIYMCWIFRQMEMRYLLHADILLLFPAAYILLILLQKTGFKSNND